MKQNGKSKENQTVRVFIPRAEYSGEGLPPDQTEQVIINGVVTEIHRGEYVDVPPEIYLALKSRYAGL